VGVGEQSRHWSGLEFRIFLSRTRTPSVVFCQTAVEGRAICPKGPRNMEVESPAKTMRTVVESVVYRPSQQQRQQEQEQNTKRKRSPSPPSSPPRRPPHRRLLPPSALPDVDPARALERERQLREREVQREKEATEEKKPFDAKAEYERLMNARSGGVYVPPARLRALQAQFTEKSSKEYQRMAWEALKKSINGLINKVFACCLRSAKC